MVIQSARIHLKKVVEVTKIFHIFPPVIFKKPFKSEFFKQKSRRINIFFVKTNTEELVKAVAIIFRAYIYTV